jgi:hypothetical protein
MPKRIQRKWLPLGLEALAPWFANFALKFDEFAVKLGFVAADVTKVQNDNLMIQWLADAQAVAEANLDSFRKFRDESLYDEKGDPAPVDPSTALPPQPAVLTTEIIERLVKLVERIQLADTYTESIGAALGIITSPEGAISPENVKATMRLFPAQSGYELAIVIEGRGNADMADAQIRRQNSEQWTTVKTGTGKSLNVTIVPTTPGQPEKIEVRVRLFRKNEPYGQASDPAYVTVNP